MYRDFYLDVTTKFEKLPDISVYNLKLNKEINGRQWHFESPKVETKDNILYSDNLKVAFTEKNGAVNRIFAEKGMVSKDKDMVKLINSRGELVTHGKIVSLNAGTAEYKVKDDSWTFDKSLQLSDGRMTVVGESGYFSGQSGECKVKGHGKISWTK